MKYAATKTCVMSRIITDVLSAFSAALQAKAQTSFSGMQQLIDRLCAATELAQAAKLIAVASGNKAAGMRCAVRHYFANAPGTLMCIGTVCALYPC